MSKDGATDNYYQKLVVSYDNLESVKTIDEMKEIIAMDATKDFLPLKALGALGGKRKSKKLRQQKSKKSKKGKINNRKTCRHCRGFY